MTGLGVLNVGWVEADNVVFALASTDLAIPILELSAFLYFFAHALAGRVVRPSVEVASAFPDGFALTTAIYFVEIGSCTFEAFIIWIGTRIDYFVLTWWGTLNKSKITIRMAAF